MPAPHPDPSRDFDFLHGRWIVRNRRLRRRLAGSTEWDEFQATDECRPTLGGLANEDVYRTDFWPGFVGMAYRFFDPATRRWSIYWADDRRGTLDPPVVGGFDGDGGIFEGEDLCEGRPVRVRFTWSKIASGSPVWQQAFSADGGASWETNWIMEFSRPAPPRRGPVDHLEGLEVVELRRYVLREGAREAFSTYFTRLFAGPFQQLGALALGEFHPRGNPTGHAWLRGFRSYEARADVCAAFYDGPVWREHRAAVNDLIVDSDDVLLLRPWRRETAIPVLPALDPVHENDGPRGVATAQILTVEPGAGEIVAERLAAALAELPAEGVRRAGLLVTLDRPNNFPRHPIREDGPFVVWLGLARDEKALAEHLLPSAGKIGRSIAAAGGLRREPETLTYDLVGGSRLRWLDDL